VKKITLILLTLCTAAVAAETPPAVKIYLPRGLQVQSDTLSLGEICIIRCDDEKILRKVSSVAMGRGPFFQESLTLGRATILSRLGAAGVDTANVVFSGAPTVTLESKDQSLAPDQQVRAAQDFLIQNKALPGDRVWQLIRAPAAMTVSDPRNVQLKARLAKQPSLPDQARVEVALVRNDKELAVAEMVFRADYLVQQAVAMEDIPAHSKLTREQFKIQIVVMQKNPAQDWGSPLAMETTQAVPLGTIIGPAQVKLPRLEVIVHRDQKVKMVVEGVGFQITGIGQAMDNGRAGDVIRVLNVDSKQTVACKVAADGTVCPMYGEDKK
jgi:flagella basal body P-ring formation protein FlgA